MREVGVKGRGALILMSDVLDNVTIFVNLIGRIV